LSQESIFKLLRDKNTWLSMKEICNESSQCKSSISINIRKLIKWGYIERKPAFITGKVKIMLYKIKN